MALQLVTKTAEVKLVEVLNDLQNPEGWKLLHFHLHRLLDEYKSDYQIKIAVNLIHDLLKHDGTIYLLADRGIILLCKDMVRPVQNKLIFQLRYLYMDDPLAYLENGDENPEFCSVFDLGQDFQKCLDAASRRMAHVSRKANIINKKKELTSNGEPAPQTTIKDLTADGLRVIEDRLRVADISRVTRKQPICGVLSGGDVRKVFDEVYINIAHLRQSLDADVDFFSNRWLFKYLTHILDERMLELVRNDSESFLAGPISLNLNAETLLSSAFSEFDAKIPANKKVSIVLEVPLVDVFADIGGFMVAKNEAQKMGYRVCLDGVTTKSLLVVDREQLGVDLLKVQWNASAQSDINTTENQALAKAIQRCGNKRIILCRCDSKQAVEFGQALGVSLFQGRYLDGMIDPNATVLN